MLVLRVKSVKKDILLFRNLYEKVILFITYHSKLMTKIHSNCCCKRGKATKADLIVVGVGVVGHTENFSKILKVQISCKFGQSFVVTKTVNGVRKSLKNRNRCHLFRWIEIGAIYLYWIEIDDYYGSSKK